MGILIDVNSTTESPPTTSYTSCKASVTTTGEGQSAYMCTRSGPIDRTFANCRLVSLSLFSFVPLLMQPRAHTRGAESNEDGSTMCGRLIGEFEDSSRDISEDCSRGLMDYILRCCREVFAGI